MVVLVVIMFVCIGFTAFQRQPTPFLLVVVTTGGGNQ